MLHMKKPAGCMHAAAHIFHRGQKVSWSGFAANLPPYDHGPTFDVNQCLNLHLHAVLVLLGCM
jgi:hypothetical protein